MFLFQSYNTTMKIAGKEIVNCLNEMTGWNRQDLERTKIDDSAPISKRVAASWWLRALSEDKTRGGLYVCEQSVKDLIDRTVGRPSQQIEIYGEVRNVQLLGLTKDSLKALESVGVSSKPPKELLGVRKPPVKKVETKDPDVEVVEMLDGGSD